MKTNHLIHIFLYLIRIYGTNYRKRLYSHGKRISLSCERLKMFSRSFRRISKFACREYKNLQFEKKNNSKKNVQNINSNGNPHKTPILHNIYRH